jgi:hypothetical protein
MLKFGKSKSDYHRIPAEGTRIWVGTWSIFWTIMSSKPVSNCKTTSVKMEIMGSKLVINCKTTSVKMEIMNCTTMQDTVHYDPAKFVRGCLMFHNFYEHKGGESLNSCVYLPPFLMFHRLFCMSIWHVKTLCVVTIRSTVFA